MQISYIKAYVHMHSQSIVLSWTYQSCLTGRQCAVMFRLAFTASVSAFGNGVRYNINIICITVLLFHIKLSVKFLNMFIKLTFMLEMFTADFSSNG